MHLLYLTLFFPNINSLSITSLLVRRGFNWNDIILRNDFFMHHISEHILHGRTGLMGAVARFLGGPGVVSPPATDSAGSVYVYAHTQESRSSALAGAMLGELALSRSRSRRSYMLAGN